MGLLLKTLNLTLAFFVVSFTLQLAGFEFFSDALFSGFGIVFFFLAALNELAMVSLPR